MPLPFSFSSQRHSFDSETAAKSGGSAVSAFEVIMHQAPGVISTEPLSPALASASGAFGGQELAASPVLLPPAPSPNQRPLLASEAFQPAPVPVPLPAHVPVPPPAPASAPVAQAPSAALLQAPSQAQPPGEWAAQVEQLRNDIFSIAMSVSALNDRLDRLEQRPPQADAGLATLRAEIGSWLEAHLHAAVQHCVQRAASSTPATAPLPAL